MIAIKFCGLLNIDDAYHAIDLGVDMLGFNFYPPSPRFIDFGTCKQIITILRSEFDQLSNSVKMVGVFVNHPVDHVVSTLQHCGLDLAQISGDEGPEMMRNFGDKAVKVIRSTEGKTLLEVSSAFPSRNFPPEFLVDASIKGEFGGTGESADWMQAAQLAKKHKIILAGGLHPENVLQAIQRVKPWGVDVASGIESSPGKKDYQKMKEFVEQVRKYTYLEVR